VKRLISILSGLTHIGGAWGPTVVSDWVLVATADFNGDGNPGLFALQGQHSANSDLVSQQSRFRQLRLWPNSSAAWGWLAP